MNLQDVKTQLDRIETKLDACAKAIATNKADLVWVKGSVKIGAMALFAILGYLAQQYFLTK